MGSSYKDMAGQKFGRLVAISFAGVNKSRTAMWLCHCECGATRVVQGSSLRNGHIKSCGCWKRDNQTKHGLKTCKMYQLWNAMMQRCHNPKSTGYYKYGARGIVVCE